MQLDYSNHMIQSLCRNNNGTVEILCFKSAASLTPFAANFHIMSGSELFLVFWRSKMDTIFGSGPTGALDSMVHVWTSAFQGCQQLLKVIQDQSIKLEDVDTQLHHRQNLETQVLKLHNCICHCHRISSATKNREAKDIRSALGRVHAYWDLCNYQTTANVFLKIRDALNLGKGDFRDVEKLSKQVLATWKATGVLVSGVNDLSLIVLQLTSSMRGQTLMDVDDGLIQTGRFLKDIAHDRHRVECLEAFAKCQNVVSWLKEVTKGTIECCVFQASISDCLHLFHQT